MQISYKVIYNSKLLLDIIKKMSLSTVDILILKNIVNLAWIPKSTLDKDKLYLQIFSLACIHVFLSSFTIIKHKIKLTGKHSSWDLMVNDEGDLSISCSEKSISLIKKPCIILSGMKFADNFVESTRAVAGFFALRQRNSNLQIEYQRGNCVEALQASNESGTTIGTMRLQKLELQEENAENDQYYSFKVDDSNLLLQHNAPLVNTTLVEYAVD